MKVRKVTKLGVLVTIDPRRPAAEAMELIKPINAVAEALAGRRHENTELVLEADDFCSLCNGRWEIDMGGEPACCNAAMDEWIAANPNHTPKA